MYCLVWDGHCIYALYAQRMLYVSMKKKSQPCPGNSCEIERCACIFFGRITIAQMDNCKLEEDIFLSFFLVRFRYSLFVDWNRFSK